MYAKLQTFNPNKKAWL